MQDHRYFKERKRSDLLEVRVAELEQEIAEQRDLMMKVIHELEVRLGDDLDGDGRAGKPKAKPKAIVVRKTRDNKHTRKQVSRNKANV